MEDAAKRASIFVTATGCCDVLRPEHFLEMRDDSILANIGHFDIEVDVAWLETNCKKVTIKPQVSHVHLNIITALLVSSTGRCVHLRLINVFMKKSVGVPPTQNWMQQSHV